MAHFNYGVPRDSLIYGKSYANAYTRNQSFPTLNDRRGGAIPVGRNYCHHTTIQVKPRFNWGAFLGGLFPSLAMVGMMIFGGNRAGNTPATQVAAQPTTQQQPADNKDAELKNLKTLFPKHNFVYDKNSSQFIATDADGNVTKASTFEEMCENLNNKSTTTKTTTTGTETHKTNEETNEETTRVVEGKVSGYEPAKAGDLKDFNGQMIVHDEVLGSRADIKGATTVSKEQTQGYPSKINVNGQEYSFQKVDNGTALYKSTSANGSGHIYRLEKNSDGQFALNQYEGDYGAGAPDITNKKPVGGGASDNKPIDEAQAQADGKSVAKDLVGYTNKEEKQRAIETIKKQNPETIKTFIKAYNKNSVMGDYILQQIQNEFGWTPEERKETIGGTIDNVLKAAEAKGLQNNQNYINLETYYSKIQNADDPAAINMHPIDGCIRNLLDEL